MRATLRFYAELKDFLHPHDSTGIVVHRFDVPGSIKDVIESCGVPHTEVDLILVNGRSVDFTYRVAGGDRISVYPVFECLDITPVIRLRPQPLRQVRFVLDGHLGKLARYLRLVGFDTVYESTWSDHEMVAISTGSPRRILLTRDRGLLKHRAVTHGYCVRASDPRRQLEEVLRRFHLTENLRPYQRCMRCNGLLKPVAKADIVHGLPPRTRCTFDEYSRCSSCRKIYWKGAHHRHLESIVVAARAAQG